MAGAARKVMVPAGKKRLAGVWSVPKSPRGVVLFAHGSGSSRLSPRNQYVAQVLQDAGLATLLMDLLDEDEADDRANVFNIELLATRLTSALNWIGRQKAARGLPIGLFGASTGAAAALDAAVLRPDLVRAVVSRGGRPDLAWDNLPAVRADTLLIVGGLDREVLQLNRKAQRRLGGKSELQIVPRATHLFEEPGTLAQAAELARNWFVRHLANDDRPSRRGFADRADAARQLAERLRGRPFNRPLVLAIPRGGVALGAIVAEELGADLDVVLSRKLRMPGNPEFALGAIAETGATHLNVDAEAIPPRLREYIDEECRHEMEEIARRRVLFREGRPPADVNGRSVIVVDDGIATGSTMLAALRTLVEQRPLEVIVAVPVGAPDRLAQLRGACDEVVCLIEAPDLVAVGQFYEDFSQVEDEEVVALLKRFAGFPHPVEA